MVLAIFAAMAETGARLPRSTEARLEDALPILSANLEDGPGLWRHLKAILTGRFAGRALRAMHALGILELVIPEFHGIDALVIRDAYHRYTVDEHTFVVIDTLHALVAEGRPQRLGGAVYGPCSASCRTPSCSIWPRCCMTPARAMPLSATRWNRLAWPTT